MAAAAAKQESAQSSSKYDALVLERAALQKQLEELQTAQSKQVSAEKLAETEEALRAKEVRIADLSKEIEQLKELNQ